MGDDGWRCLGTRRTLDRPDRLGLGGSIAPTRPGWGWEVGPARLRRCIGAPSVARRQPARKLSRTVRLALSAFGSSRQIDCQVPRASRPPSTGTVSDGDARSGATWSAPCPGDPWRWRYSRSSRGSSRSSASSRSSSEPAPTSTRPSPAVAWGTKMESRPSSASMSPRNAVQAAVRSARPRADPVRTVSSRVSTGRCSGGRRGSCRDRPSPARTRSAAARRPPAWSRPTGAGRPRSSRPG
jgi:hypothetical protein